MGFSTFPNNPFPPSTAQFEEGKNDEIQAEIDAMKDGTNIDSFGDVESALALKANNVDMQTALAAKTNLSNVAPTFDATSGVYAIGDNVIYDGVLYEFTSAHSTAGDWDESEVQPVKVSELLDELKSGLISSLMKTQTSVTAADFLAFVAGVFDYANGLIGDNGNVLINAEWAGQNRYTFIVHKINSNTLYAIIFGIPMIYQAHYLNGVTTSKEVRFAD